MVNKLDKNLPIGTQNRIPTKHNYLTFKYLGLQRHLTLKTYFLKVLKKTQIPKKQAFAF